MRKTLAFLLILLVALPAHARRRPRYKKQIKKRPLSVHLKSAEWTAQNRSALEIQIDALGRFNPNYSPDSPPIAVFILDDVAVRNHAGEAIFYRLVTHAEFKFGEPFWKLIPEPFKSRARAGYEDFKGVKPVAWPNDASYKMYRRTMYNAYKHICDNFGRPRCYAWLTSLLYGFEEPRFQEYAAAAIDDELKTPLKQEKIFEFQDDVRPIMVRRGLRLMPALKELFDVLHKQGWDVWVFSSSNYWSAQILAAKYGVDRTRVTAVRSRIQNGILQADTLDLVPEGVGEAEALSEVIGRGPDLGVGGSMKDKDFLDFGGGLRLVFDQGDKAIVDHAHSKGWLVQPALAVEK